MLVRFASDALHSSSGWQAAFSAGKFMINDKYVSVKNCQRPA